MAGPLAAIPLLGNDNPVLSGAPDPLPLIRACSLPTSAIILQPLSPCLENRRQRKDHKSPPEAGLVRAVEALASKVESLGARLAEGPAARQGDLANLAEALSEIASGGGFSGVAAAVESKESATPQAQGSLSRRRWPSPPAPMEEHRDGQNDQRGEDLESLQQRRQKDCADQRAARMQALRELTEAVQALRPQSDAFRGKADDTPAYDVYGAAVAARHPAPVYRPHIGGDGCLYEFPEVELAIKVNKIGNVDTKQLTFEADFVCHLDWCDSNVESIPSEELKFLDWKKYFNPQIEVDNGKDNAGWLDGLEDMPRRRRSTSPDRHLSSVGVGRDGFSRMDCPQLGTSGSRLRKTLRFRGTLSIAAVSLKCFPFDIQMLPVKLKAARCRGLALGTPDSSAGVAVDDDREQISLVSLKTNRATMFGDGYQSTDAHLRGQGHYAVPTAGHSLLEFEICGLTGCHPDQRRCDVYELCIFVERPFFASYFWDLVIMNLFVMLAATAFWDTAAPELSSRMSISLTVILTLAAYTSSRPTPIAKAPYVTFHDWCEQMSMLLVTGISVQNVFAVVLCGGQHEEAPSYMVEEFNRNLQSCELGWCMSRKIDCQGLVILLTAWLALAVYSCIWLVRTRSRATRGLRERLLSLAASSMGDEQDLHAQRDSGSRDAPMASVSSDSLGSWSAKLRRKTRTWCGSLQRLLSCCRRGDLRRCLCRRFSCTSWRPASKQDSDAEAAEAGRGSIVAHNLQASPSGSPAAIMAGAVRDIETSGESYSTHAGVGSYSSDISTAASGMGSPARPRPRPLSLGRSQSRSGSPTPSWDGDAISSSTPRSSSAPSSPSAALAPTPSRPCRPLGTPPGFSRFGVPAPLSPPAQLPLAESLSSGCIGEYGASSSSTALASRSYRPLGA